MKTERELNRIRTAVYREANRKKYNAYQREYRKKWAQQNPGKEKQYYAGKKSRGTVSRNCRSAVQQFSKGYINLLRKYNPGKTDAEIKRSVLRSRIKKIIKQIDHGK